MKIERKIEENGGITDVITLTEEENNAIDEAHKIVAERYKKLGLEQTAWEKEHLEYVLQGRLRFDGIEEMLKDIYEKRVDALRSKGIYITFEELLSYYK